MDKETNDTKLSKEELEKLMKDRVDFMKKQLPNLKIQSEFSKLKADIAENTLREHMSKVKLITLKTPPEPEKDKEEKTKE